MRTLEEIKWCLENEKLIAYWLEQRGGWQARDICIGIIIPNRGILGQVLWHKIKTLDAEFGYSAGWAVSEIASGDLHWYCNKEKRVSENWLWLPGIGDVLTLLEAKVAGFIDLYRKAKWYESLPNERYGAVCGSLRGDGPTWLIALMELLKL